MTRGNILLANQRSLNFIDQEKILFTNPCDYPVGVTATSFRILRQVAIARRFRNSAAATSRKDMLNQQLNSTQRKRFQIDPHKTMCKPVLHTYPIN